MMVTCHAVSNLWSRTSTSTSFVKGMMKSRYREAVNSVNSTHPPIHDLRQESEKGTWSVFVTCSLALDPIDDLFLNFCICQGFHEPLPVASANHLFIQLRKLPTPKLTHYPVISCLAPYLNFASATYVPLWILLDSACRHWTSMRTAVAYSSSSTLCVNSDS